MDIFTAIEERRSIKHYDPDHVMSGGDEKKLLEAALLSPTSFNIQNWRFVVVRDKANKKALRGLCYNQAQIEECSLVIILCADLHASKKEPARYWRDAPEQVRDMIVPMIGQWYDGNEALQRDEAMRSTGIAGQTIMLAAKGMGLDTCPMVGFDQKKVAEYINLPEDHCISMIITVGKAVKEANPRAGQLPYDEVVRDNSF